MDRICSTTLFACPEFYLDAHSCHLCRSNVPEAVYMQHLMGVNGVIVDLVPEITEAVSELIALPEPDLEGDNLSSQAARGATTPNFSQREISFLLRLIPELVQ